MIEHWEELAKRMCAMFFLFYFIAPALLIGFLIEPFEYIESKKPPATDQRARNLFAPVLTTSRLLGSDTFFKLVSPVAKRTQSFEIEGILRDGRTVSFGFPNYSEEYFKDNNVLVRQLADYKMQKVLERLYSPEKNNLLHYLCRRYRIDYPTLQSVTVRRHAVVIPPPKYAEKFDPYQELEANPTTTIAGKMNCSHVTDIARVNPHWGP